MKQHMQVFIHLVSKNNDNALLQHYLASKETENLVQLAHLFQESMSDASRFDFYQQLATKCIESKSLPIALIAQIKTSYTLSFFTTALQLKENFKKTDHLQRNVLHYLFAGTSVESNELQFNYLRSMMLFESNETLRDALCQRDDKNLTPIETYFIANKNLTALPKHELIALMALIEIESKQKSVDASNYRTVIETFIKLCHSQYEAINSELERLILIAIYFSKPVKEIINEVKEHGLCI